MPVVVPIAAALIAVFVAVQLAGPRLLDYRMSEKGLEVLLIRRFPVRLVPLDYIVDVSEGPPGKWDYILALRLGSRFGPAIMVRTRRPLLWRILVTPSDPDEFVRCFREVTRRTPEAP